MLPAHLAENIRKQVLYYLQSTFTFRDKPVERAFEEFVTDPDTGLFKGPWVQLKRPFRTAPDDFQHPFDINVPFHPFSHQANAWTRLAGNDRFPKPTLVTTGTGSGKTECFMYPVLDHCLRMKREGQKGIKAIVLYPMNALASDQEQRFAKTVWRDEALKSMNIRVGTYTGWYDPEDPGASAESGTREMGETHGITHHGTLQETPPDILLTNYKMLDFLLMRPGDQPLWRFNTPGVLRYLVLDELHTYDGAQGSDVACLIRRLKERMGVKTDNLCMVGTSATLDNSKKGSDSNSVDGTARLIRFATTLFEAPFERDAVIEEDRFSIDEIVTIDQEQDEDTVPHPSDCQPQEGEDALAYTARQTKLWGGPSAPEVQKSQADTDKAFLDWSVEVGTWIKKKPLFKQLLVVFEQAANDGDDPLSWSSLVGRLTQKDFALRQYEDEEQLQLVLSFFAVVAHARELRSGTPFPLVPTQVQLWIRELRRIGRVVEAEPRFCSLDEPPAGLKSLPAFQCSHCGESGWIGFVDAAADTKIRSKGVEGFQISEAPNRIYQAWFTHDQFCITLIPWTEEDDRRESQQSLDIVKQYLCPESLVVRSGEGLCPVSDAPATVRVKIDRHTITNEQGKIVGYQRCPRCNVHDGIFFIGSRSATLSSVAIDEMFGSVLNNDPKLLAFTDNVQDASHRAGFFTARTYHFSLRTAMQHVIDKAGESGVPLWEMGERLIDYWSQKGAGRLGNIKEAIAALVPPDLQQYEPFVSFRDNDEIALPPESLLREIETRLTWEAVSEFGLMKTHGRTLETSGVSAVGWDLSIITDTIAALQDRLPKLGAPFQKIDDQKWRYWMLGFLHRYRERGALSHSYVQKYAQTGAWGKTHYGKPIPERETFPPAIRYRPKLLVNKPQKDHDCFTAVSSGSALSWPVKWSLRVFQRPNLDETVVVDLLKEFFAAGVSTGLFVELQHDGPKTYYAINSAIAVIHSRPLQLECSETGRRCVRPAGEAVLWQGQRSLEYYGDMGVYKSSEYDKRQLYYHDRYRKGALRRVVAFEHTGMLTTKERTQLEQQFALSRHADDANVITCTSTLEMGIDIGDLSSTMLCSVPPTTAGYLQRIGRAGRSTGTALIVAIVNQRPHDLFFYARPAEMLRGQVEPPGCWLDASAVLSRQYLAFCFDTAVKEGVLTEMPKSGTKLVEDLENPQGQIPGCIAWLNKEAPRLTETFLRRFQNDISDDTRTRFVEDIEPTMISQRIHLAARQFDSEMRSLKNAGTRLESQRSGLDETDIETRQEIDRELRILKGRRNRLNLVKPFEIFTDHGLLPNYAFPERGVRFYGAVYNRHAEKNQSFSSFDLMRPAGQAIRELAPGNTFYTHKRQFLVQQVAIGNKGFPIVEQFGICGNCGHMRHINDLGPGASPACPQCGHEGDGLSQLNREQQRNFLEYSRSQAISYMDHYDSLSGDRSEERNTKGYYQLSSFDQTREMPIGAVGDDDLPFGIEYRFSMTLRHVNAGNQNLKGIIPFGGEQKVPEEGFRVCSSCGVVAETGNDSKQVRHRRSCQGRRTTEKRRQEGKHGDAYEWETIYLYRELTSEAIRLLLPLSDNEHVDTLVACIHLGLKLRFEGNPAHLLVESQVLPDASGLEKRYLVLMDAVPGGTGYLKTLYQEKDAEGRAGEGIMDILRRAKQALENCECRKLKAGYAKSDTDGCYRCIRTYHLQSRAAKISATEGIKLLDELIASGERRASKETLEQLKPTALFDSVLEKRFVQSLEAFVEKQGGNWETTIVRGKRGWRFKLDTDRLWELSTHPIMDKPQGVYIKSEPDFLLTCDDPTVKPSVVFADGFEYHCRPPNNRLADDMKKRRAILDSGNYHVWSVTWNDLNSDESEVLVCPQKIGRIAPSLTDFGRKLGKKMPNSDKALRNGFSQICAYISEPNIEGWSFLARLVAFVPLQQQVTRGGCDSDTLATILYTWKSGEVLSLSSTPDSQPEWLVTDALNPRRDILAYAQVSDVISSNRDDMIILARLPDDDSEIEASEFENRWRSFLGGMNLFQFVEDFEMWSCSEIEQEYDPDLLKTLAISPKAPISSEWAAVIEEVVDTVRPIVRELAKEGLPAPEVEFYDDALSDDLCAELAWTDVERRVVLLQGDQFSAKSVWEAAGWRVVTAQMIQENGLSWLKQILGLEVESCRS